MLGLKLNRVSKSGHWGNKLVLFPTNDVSGVRVRQQPTPISLFKHVLEFCIYWISLNLLLYVDFDLRIVHSYRDDVRMLTDGRPYKSRHLAGDIFYIDCTQIVAFWCVFHWFFFQWSLYHWPIYVIKHDDSYNKSAAQYPMQMNFKPWQEIRHRSISRICTLNNIRISMTTERCEFHISFPCSNVISRFHSDQGTGVSDSSYEMVLIKFRECYLGVFSIQRR